MLDELIAERTRKQDHSRRVALRLQRIARIVVAPAALLMIVGLIWFAVSAQSAGRAGVVPLGAIFSRAALTPIGAMSAGLLALALLPVINVLYLLADSIIVKRWKDAAAAAAVAGILILSMILGRA